MIYPDCTATSRTYFYSVTGCTADNPDKVDQVEVEIGDFSDELTSGAVRLVGNQSTMAQLSVVRRDLANSLQFYGFTDWMTGIEKDVTNLEPLNVGESKFVEGMVFYLYMNADTAASQLSFGKMPVASAAEVDLNPSSEMVLLHEKTAGFGDCSEIAGSYRTDCLVSGIDRRVTKYGFTDDCRVTIENEMYSDAACTLGDRTFQSKGLVNLESGSFSGSSGANASIYIITAAVRPDSTLQADIDQMNSELHFGFDDWAVSRFKNVTFAAPGASLPQVTLTQEGDRLGPMVIAIGAGVAPNTIEIGGDTAYPVQ